MHHGVLINFNSFQDSDNHKDIGFNSFYEFLKNQILSLWNAFLNDRLYQTEQKFLTIS
jgi:hypothetical protein